MSFSKICVLMFVLVMGLPHAASAGLFDSASKQTPDANQFYIHDEESFNSNTKPYHEIPFNNPKFEFSILVPKDWTAVSITQQGNIKLSQNILGDISRFTSPIIGTERATLAIQSIQLDHDLSAENWMKNYIYTNGYSIQDTVIPANNKRASATFVSIFEGKATLTYATVQINGNAAIVARFEIPLTLKEPLTFMQHRAVDSFKLIVTTNEPVEGQKNYTLSSALKLSYPQSWSLHNPDLRDPRNVSAQIYNESQKGAKIDGVIRFAAVHRSPKTSLNNEMKSIRKYFNEALGLDIKEMVSSGKAPVYNRFSFSQYEIYKVTSKKNDAAEREVRFVVLGDSQWYIFMFLLTPIETDNLYVWACNIQAFDSILKGLK